MHWLSSVICCTQEILGGGNFWQTIQVKAIDEENLMNKLQSVHMPNTFLVHL